MRLKQMAQWEKSRLEKTLSKTTKLRNDEEAGTLYSKRRPNGYFQFYKEIEGQPGLVYINKSGYDWILKQLHHRFAVESGKVLENDLQVLDHLLAEYEEYKPSKIIDNLPRSYQDAWEFCEQKGLLRADFQKEKPGRPRFHSSEKTNDPAELKHLTSFGLRVRSKGEALIAELLYFYTDLEFYYEKKLTLTDPDGRPIPVYPDFTILLGLEGYLFWEHKGMMLNEDYLRADQRKMRVYFENGIFPPKNLIVTCDGPDGSTDMQSILKLIHGYFDAEGKTLQ